jgi:hypothetical protein
MRIASSIFLAFCAPLFLAPACSSSVEIAGTSASSSGASSSSSTGGAACTGFGPTCVWGCGSDASSSAECKNGLWSCPPGTVDMNTCPPGTCWGPPLPCEVCNNGWKCAPTPECIGTCESLVCATCEGMPGVPIQMGACSCSCKNGVEYGCSLAPGCCNANIDCGDESFVPCVEHVCKQPVIGRCWVDAECGLGMKCEGAVVCPCGYDCDVEDSPGMCVPG